MSHRSMATVVAACAAALVLAACGGGGGGTTASSGPSTTSGGSSAGQASTTGDSVSIKDFAYSPPDLTVSTGTMIKFTNQDSTNHTATASGGAFDTGTIGKGQSKVVALQSPGTFAYVCSFHPFMHGTITVK
jgi:plastocyanin